MMTFETGTVVMAGAIYLLLFYSVAWLADKNRLSPKLINHPLLYTLSLGIVVSTFSFYGALTSASARGFGYAAFYLGFGAAFLFAPLLLQPYLRITRSWQLASLADVFAFRFRSAWGGTITTLVLLICAFPIIGFQVLAAAQSSALLAPDINPDLAALAYCFVLLFLTIRFGTRDVSGRERNSSLVTSLAFESVIKLFVLLVMTLFTVFAVFKGPGNLQQWLQTQPDAMTRLDRSFMSNSTNLVILQFLAAAIAQPHMFHMIFHENRNPQHLRIASWGVPLVLLIASLPVLPMLWSYEYLDVSGDVQYAGLLTGMMMESPAMTLLFYTGALAAGNGMTIIMTMSVSSMVMNHIMLRVKTPPAGQQMYGWLKLYRRLVILGIFVIGYLSYLALNRGFYVNDARNMSFIASIQFLPAILALLYWPRANRAGFLWGLAAGLAVWFSLGLLPLITGVSPSDISFQENGLINWNLISVLSMMANLATLIMVSLSTRTRKEELRAADMCNLLREGIPAQKRLLVARNPEEFIQSLVAPLGEEGARHETLKALADLGLDFEERRPFFLQQLRNQIGNNLSALLGPTIGYSTVERFLPYSNKNTAVGSTDIRLMESRLEAWPGSLTGIALDLDLLRRHHRQILHDLPLGVCTVDKDGRISLWNRAMENITGINPENLFGLPLDQLPAPWNNMLENFLANTTTNHLFRRAVVINGRQRSLNLHKADLDRPEADNPDDMAGNAQVIIVEDQTETSLLEHELAHAERLSSIGMLAAGVAHEIGNPVTGIACLAQNLREECVDEQHRDMSDQIIQQTRRISAIVQSLVSYSHSGKQDDKPAGSEKVSLRDAANEAINLISLQKDERNIRYRNLCDSSAQLVTDKQLILQIMLNLITNARDASPEGAEVDISTSGSEGEVTFMVTDRGSGIPLELRSRVFEPFYTTKEPGKGTGLGLSIVYQIVTGLGGNVQLSTPFATSGSKGTQVIVTFPCYDPQF
jgi:PAS domain S-box-containing protein